MVFGMSEKAAGIKFRLGEHEISLDRDVDYLGMVLNREVRLRHIFGRVVKALSVLLPNIKGPRASKRRVMCNAIQANVMYGAEIWVGAIKTRMCKEMLSSTQWQMALRVCSAYCTVSEKALQVVAGQIAIHLLTLERENIQKEKRRSWRDNIEIRGKKANDKYMANRVA